MIWIDYTILTPIGLSAVVGLFRGFIREAFSLASWGIGIWVGTAFSRQVSEYLETYISVPPLRIAAAFMSLFLTVLLLGNMAGYLITQLVNKTGLTGSDRFLGLFFGIGRGVLVIAVIVLLAGLTPLPESPWWHESQLITPFQSLAFWLRDQIPATVPS